jgi:hypothetical protein
MGKQFRCLWILFTLVLCSAEAPAQEHPYSAAVFGSFTTSSKLFPHPNDVDEFISNQFLPLDNIFSAGIDIRRSLEPLRIQIGISVEYISKSESFSTLPDSEGNTIASQDGFTAIPVELSGYFPVPVGGEKIQMYIGGGAGVYFGSRHYAYAGSPSVSVEHKTGVGIQILSGVEYMIGRSVSLRSEVKFRNVQFETTNQFTRTVTVYQNSVVSLSQEPMASRINIDGMTMTLQMVFHF